MASGPVGVVLRQLGRLVAAETAADSDGELLARFLGRRDEAAFAGLMRRHGPMVLAVCRRVLSHAQDAEDAFQATFLLLAQRGGDIRKRDSLSSWLHGVAYRLSARSRGRRREPVDAANLIIPSKSEEPAAAAAWRELQGVLDEEVQRLPDVCRAALVLCYLEGASHEEAAARLGWPVGSVKSRLTRARQLLRDRLARRGIGLSGAALAAFLAADGAAATLPAPLLAVTLNAVRPIVEGTALAGAATENVMGLLAHGGRFALARRGAPLLAVALTTLALVGGAVLVARRLAADAPPAEQPQPPPRAAIQAGERPRADSHGDPLPAGVLTRFGSVRLRHGISLRSVVFSPTEDLIVSSGGGAIAVWDAQTGKEILRHADPATSYAPIALARDGATLATDDQDDIVLREAKTGRELRRLTGHKGPIAAMSLSAKGDRLASTARDRTIRLWDTAIGKELLKIDSPHENDAHSLMLAPDAGFIISASYDKSACLFDAATGKELRRFTIKEGTLQSAALSPDGRMLATNDEKNPRSAKDDAGVRLWDVASGRELRQFQGQRTRGYFAFAPDGRTFATGAGDGIVRVYEVATGKKLGEFQAAPESIASLSYSRDGKTLATAYPDSPIHLWDADTGKQKLTMAGHQERLRAAAWSPDGRRVASGGWDRTVRVWDAADGKELLRLEGKFTQVERLAFSPDGARLFATVLDSKRFPLPTHRYAMLIWDAATGKLLEELEGHEPALSRDGRLSAAVTHTQQGGVVVVRDRTTGKELHRLGGHKSQIRQLEFTSDGRSLAVLVQNVLIGFRGAGEEERQDNNAIHLWDVASGRKLRAFGSKHFAMGLTVAPEGRTLATAEFRGGAVNLWEALTGQERGQAVGHQETVFGLAFSPDGRTLATGGMDGTLRLWELPSLKELRRLEGHRGWVLAVAWSADGTKIVTTSTDTTALVWDVSDLPKTAAKPLDRAALEAAWADLLGNGRSAYAALGKLWSSPAESTAFLAERLQPAPALAPAVLARLLVDLRSDKFAVRDAATKELEKHADTSEAALRKALEAETELESRRRLEALLERIRLGRLRELRAVEALERMGGDEARAVLRELAAGKSAAAQEAAASLQRLAP